MNAKSNITVTLVMIVGSLGTLTAANSMPMIERQLAVARAELAAGHRHLENGLYVHASEACLRGIDTVGSSYYSPDLIDDTGQKLSAALASGEKVASTIRCRVLEARILLLEKKAGKGEKPVT